MYDDDKKVFFSYPTVDIVKPVIITLAIERKSERHLAVNRIMAFL